MDWIRKIASTALLLSVLLIVNSCSIKVGLAPISSIDYSKVKTVSIADFQNRAEYVYAPLATEFNQGLKDLFIRQTRLSLVNGNADIVKVTLTVKVSFVNNTDHKDDFTDQQFSAFQTYDSSKLLTEVQDELIKLMVKDITEQIFNATVANW